MQSRIRQDRGGGGAGKRQGFALLITITLLSFAVLLLVGLATYTRIETAIAGNMQRQAAARENALLALNVAVGQLQKAAGPDKRVTAIAAGSGNPHWTGVWSTDPSDPAFLTPVWLVAGSEMPSAPDPATPLDQTGDNNVRLVGPKTASNAADHVWVQKQVITAPGLPGQTAAATVGRYAWWIGDQGVKAPVAVPDNSGAINYAPFVTIDAQNKPAIDLRERIRQQISLGAGPADTGGRTVFDPRETVNASIATNVTAMNQLAFFSAPGSTTMVGLAQVQQNYHSWSPNNFAVLTNTKMGGLRQDLSLFSPQNPSPLGSAYDAWANYDPATGGYMEPPVSGGANPPKPDYSTDPLRRRYFMQSGQPLLSPVLTFCLLSFNVRTAPTPSGNPSASIQPLQVRLRGAFTLWNPYSSALVPENLRLEISVGRSGLPADVFLNNVTNPAASRTIPFASRFGSPIRFSLPWNTASTGDERHSWLPGRAYSWTIKEDVSRSAPAGGYLCELNSQDLDGTSRDGLIEDVPGMTMDGSDICSIEFTGHTEFTIALIAERASGDVPLAIFTSPRFEPFTATKPSLGHFTWTPTFAFGLAEGDNGNGPWLSLAGHDPREAVVVGAAYLPGVSGQRNGPLPDQYPDTKRISAPERLLDRDVASFSFDEDVPVFELPRAPILSVGELQHLHVPGGRPFSVGNSWGATTALNGIPAGELFDRFFFSGVTPVVTPVLSNGSLLLPNPLLKVLRDSKSGAAIAPDDLRNSPGARSSKFLLQGGAFNLNSGNSAAWAAVLRSLRLPNPQTFDYLNAEFATGTAADLKTSAVISGAQFFRFAQSAHETYRATDPDPVSGSTYAASTVESPGPPDPTSTANTHLYRRGAKTLSGSQVQKLAEKIAAAVTEHAKAENRYAGGTPGPFRSLDEFLAPVAGGPSLLEQAIVDADADGAQINVDASGNAIPFSSQYLTQADIMTALAPVLFPRSDTFVIRTYGEAVNPATNAVEGRAWAEATVQRLPEYFDATADPPETEPAALASELNKLYGRRFKIVSFRWLTRSDI